MDSLRCVRISQFEANLRVGLDDPADTGFLFALIGPAVVLLGAFRHHQITVVPSFEDDMILEGYVAGTAHLRPIQLMPPFLRFAFSPPARNILKDKVLTTWRQQT